MSTLIDQEKSKYDRNMDSNYLGFNWAKIRGDGAFWAGELGKHWDKIEAIQSKEHALRYITIGRN